MAVTATTPHHTSQSSQAVGPPSHFSGEFRICRNNSETHTHTNNELYLIYLILSDQVSNNYYNHYQWLLNIISFIGFYWIRFHWNHRYRNTDRVLYRNESIMGGVFHGYGSMGLTNSIVNCRELARISFNNKKYILP